MDSLKGKRVKVVYKDGGKEKVVKGVLQDIDEYTISIRADITHATILIGKQSLVSMMEVRE